MAFRLTVPPYTLTAFENRNCTGEAWDVQPLDLAALGACAVCEPIFVCHIHSEIMDFCSNALLVTYYNVWNLCLRGSAWKLVLCVCVHCCYNCSCLLYVWRYPSQGLQTANSCNWRTNLNTSNLFCTYAVQ